MSPYEQAKTMEDISHSGIFYQPRDPALRMRKGYLGRIYEKARRWITCEDIIEEHMQNIERIKHYYDCKK